MIEFRFNVKGFAQLERRLATFGDRVVKNGLRSANYAAAKVVREATQMRLQNGVPKVITGTLVRAISVFRRRSSTYAVTHAVGIRRLRRDDDANPAAYGRYLEFGTSKMRPHPFLRPAFDATLGQQIRAIRDRLRQVIQQESAK